MTEDAAIEEHIEAVRELLKQTRGGRVHWQATSDPEVFSSVRSKAVAVLDRIGEPARVRLRFSILDHTNSDVIIEQAAAYSQQPCQRTLYKLLVALWHEVGQQAGQRRRASDLFLRSESETPDTGAHSK